jgi:[methyl-Co(III) methanol-specific corrinoid protein]:coenzyme M methyltransferase
MSAYQLAAQLRGFKQMVVDLMKHDPKVKPLLGKCLEVSKRFAAVLVEEGADVISIGNASSSMDILSPGAYMDSLAEYDRRLSEAIRKKGALAQMHICGNIAPILGELDRMVDIVDVDHKVGVEDSVRGLRKAAIKGNMDPSLVRFRPAEEVRERAREIVTAVRKAGRSRSFVFSTGCEVPRDTPHASVGAMIASAREAWKA